MKRLYTTKCLNNYNESEINMYFAESEESLSVCNKCPNFTYDGKGTMSCRIIDEKKGK